jgi:hypothetical protein
MKYSHGVLYLQKLDIRAVASDLQNDENKVMNKANEGVPFSPFYLVSRIHNRMW